MNKLKRPRELTTRFLLDFYDICLRAKTVGEICAGLDINITTFNTWLKKWPDLVLAKQIAEENRAKRSTLSGYVFSRLSGQAREVWDKIKFWDGHTSAGEKTEEILSGHPVELRQELFVHALASSNFNASEACRVVNTNVLTLNEWKKDYKFRQLIEEIQWHKKNFFENALVELVDHRVPGAVMFVNRTINKDRGYGEKMEIEHTGKVDVNTSFSFEELDLDSETMGKVLAAIQRKKELKQAQVTEINGTPLQLEEYANK